LSTLILVALVCLLIGATAGSLLTRTLHPQEKLRRELEEQLRRAREDHKAYQHEVTAHFARTADLVGNLAQNFHAVHEQLATSAMHLATPEVSRKLMEAASRTALKGDPRDTFTISDILPEPPRDYAPSVPGGVLSEDYGLEPDTASRTARVGTSTDSGPAGARNEEEEDPTLKVS